MEQSERIKIKLNIMVDRLAESMTVARESADALSVPGSIALPQAAYRELYFSVREAKQVLEALKNVL